jgi:hypothetical protein
MERIYANGIAMQKRASSLQSVSEREIASLVVM